MTTILLIRHGENDSLGKYLPGHLAFIHLNEAGKSQAFLVADSLKDIPITSIISSPLERAVETADPLAKMLGLTIDIRTGIHRNEHRFVDRQELSGDQRRSIVGEASVRS